MSVRSSIGQYGIIPAWILDTDLSSKAVHLFSILSAKYADRNGECFPGRKTIAKDLGDVSLDTVDRTIKELVAVGALEIESRFSEGGHQSSNLYTIHFVRPPSRTDAAEGSRTDAALTIPNSNQIQEEPEETPSSELSSSVITTEDNSSSAPLKGAKKKSTEIDEEFRVKMRERYSPVLLDSVDDIIDLALAHKAAGKYKDQQCYVNNWLRRETERIRPASSREPNTYTAPDNPFTLEERKRMRQQIRDEQQAAIKEREDYRRSA